MNAYAAHNEFHLRPTSGTVGDIDTILVRDIQRDMPAASGYR